MAREELKWQNIDADDLPADVKHSFDAMVAAEAAFKVELEKLLKKEGHMPEDKYLLISRKGKRLGVAYASTPRGEGGAASPGIRPVSLPLRSDPLGQETPSEMLTPLPRPATLKFSGTLMMTPRNTKGETNGYTWRQNCPYT